MFEGGKDTIRKEPHRKGRQIEKVSSEDWVDVEWFVKWKEGIWWRKGKMGVY